MSDATQILWHSENRVACDEAMRVSSYIKQTMMTDPKRIDIRLISGNLMHDNLGIQPLLIVNKVHYSHSLCCFSLDFQLPFESDIVLAS